MRRETISRTVLTPARAMLVLSALALAVGCSCPQSSNARGRAARGQDASAGSFAFFGGLMGMFADTPPSSEARSCRDGDLSEKTKTTATATTGTVDPNAPPPPTIR